MSAPEIPSRWDDEACAGATEPELLLYRSNLLGSDLRVTNYGGGNTSAKVSMPDPLTGEMVSVLWVKGSGGDLGSMGMDGFATLYLERILALEGRYRGREHEDEMVGCLPHCTFGLNPRAASIDTPLHAFVPHRHVDHMHPDAVIAIAAAAGGERLAGEAFGGELGWIPWQRPGFDLGLKLGALCRARPGLKGAVLGGHGLFTWGATARECYEATLAAIDRAASFLAARARPAPFGGSAGAALAPGARRAFVIALAPSLRGRLGVTRAKVGHFVDSAEVLDFVASRRMRELAARGTSCPDHFLRTKIRPLVLDCDPGLDSPPDVAARLDGWLAAYRADYAAYYKRCRRSDSPPMRDPDPVIVLVPRVGLLSFAPDKATARVAAEFYGNAINVMRGATDLSDYIGLAELEAFGVEYWPLEEAKLRRLPPPRPMDGRVAVVTGGAGGIGRAVAERLLAAGASAVLADLAGPRLDLAVEELAGRFGPDRVRAAVADVTDEAAVVGAISSAVAEYGGLDVLVASAGIASAAPIDETSLALWRRNLDVLATGYFLFAREAFRVMKVQGTGGSIVFVGSKNAIAASGGAAAYNVAKASELHLARCLALEGARHGIRANVVNPDAVLHGSAIWAGEWRAERAAAYGVPPEELEEHYRRRSLLQRCVLPADVAEAVYFFASDLSAKSTGNVLNVDAGHLAAFPR
ncbi:MAG: bifunctional rhamnulose-1-phosphate aldolase/short-chain dehydrogenase [Planctomycetota bacterium]